MHVHILGICGTFMGGIAAIAKAQGHQVTGSDANVYPPMSTQLESLGIILSQADDLRQFDQQPDITIIGNAFSRGHRAVEYILERNLAYTNGPQWLFDNVLKNRWVLAVSGTHGKTTTSSMLAWILEYAGMKPGYLIGGIPQNFDTSARLGDEPFFVIEADEYDSAFFDKRSKFVHYHPRTLVINNMEFDHADIFDSIQDIQKQFHHLVRTVPANGLILSRKQDDFVKESLEMGCWSEQQIVGLDWQVALDKTDGSAFTVSFKKEATASVSWSLLGEHNVNNAIMAIAAARHVGVTPTIAAEALCEFKNVKRRMELRGEVNQIKVYDDFAHHPTAIATTLQGLRANVGNKRIIAVLEPRSNTMKSGIHGNALAESWQQADDVFVFQPQDLGWSVEAYNMHQEIKAIAYNDIDLLVSAIAQQASPNDHVLVMSNGGFGGIHEKILSALSEKTI